MNIQKVGIVGGGKMAIEVFKLLIDTDLEVVLWARRSEAVAELEEELKRKLRRKAKKGGDLGAEAEARLARLTITSDLEALRDVDLISESVTELLQPKRDIFAQLDRIVKPEALFTTNSSSLAPSSIAVATNRRERFAGLHFFHPASLLGFVEIIPTRWTVPETSEALAAFVLRLGRRPIPVQKEIPGHLVNRILMAYYNEGSGIVGEGYWEPGQVDRIGRRFALMGPCESMDQASIDMAVNGYRSADESYGMENVVERLSRGFKRFPPVYFKMFNDGRLGQKVGLGFYRYEGNTRSEDPEYFCSICPDLIDYHRVDAGDAEAVEQRLFFSILLEAISMVEHGIGAPEDIDAAIRQILGLEKGPFAYLETADLGRLQAICRDLEARFGPHLAPLGVLKAPQNV